MKIRVLCVLVLCALWLSGCGAKEEKTVYSGVGGSYIVDGSNDIASKIEVDWWLGKSTQKDSLKETKKTEKIQGKTYDTAYEKSLLENFDWQYTDVYSAKGITLYYKEGSFTGYHITSREFLDAQKEIAMPSDPYQNALSVAQKCAEQYIRTEDYVLEETIVNSFYDIDLPMTVYVFRFVKHHSGFRTSESVYVEVTEKGGIRSFHIKNIGAFDGSLEIQIDKQAIEQSVANVLENTYGGEERLLEYEIVKQTLTYTPEGDLAVCSQVEGTRAAGTKTGIVITTVLE